MIGIERVFTDKKSVQIGFVCLIRVLLFLFFSVSSFAQLPQDSAALDDALLKDKIENLAENSEENSDYTTLLDPFHYYKEHPVNLNSATQAELQQLSILNDLQVQALLNHINRNGKLVALEELQTIDGFDAETINRILPYVTLDKSAGEPTITPKRIISDGKSRLLLRYHRVVEEQKGYQRNDSVPFSEVTI